MELPHNIDEYENLTVVRDPLHNDLIRAIAIIKTFIKQRNLIVYGGTAIDFALRTVGKSIYSDDTLAVPDLDFYSPQNVADSYDLADLLYDAGFVESRSIVGTHATTQRVDPSTNHFLADISYCPEQILNLIPTMEYLGVKIVHPHYQLIDQHSAMSFLYDEPPKEVVFHRLIKDNKRCGLLLDAFPIVVPKKYDELPKHNTSIEFKNYIPCGLTAYALYYHLYKSTCKSPDPSIIPMEFTNVGNKFTFDHRVELAHFDLDKAIESLKLQDVKRYKPMFNLHPERIETPDVIVYSTQNRLLSVVSCEINGVKLRLSCFQYLLRYLIAQYHVTKLPIYLAYYNSCHKMIPKNPSGTPFYISIDFYGKDNKSLSYEKTMNYLKANIYNTPLPNYPKSYYVERGNRPEVLTGKEFDVDGSLVTN
jgi:hypothetical protein